MAIDYFHIKEHDFDLIQQIIDIEADTYGKAEALDAFELIAMLRHARVYVAVENEVLIGYVYFMKNFDVNNKVLLHSINVVDSDKYPNLGISLMNIAFKDMVNSGIETVEVNVNSDNESAYRKYTEKLGFTEREKLNNSIFCDYEVIILSKDIY